MAREVLQAYNFLTEPQIAGLTPEIAGDIRDLLEKTGFYVPVSNEISLQIIPTNGTSTIIIACTPELREGFMIWKEPISHFSMVETTRGGIAWDACLSIEEVIATIRLSDEQSRRSGYINYDTGERLPQPLSYAHYLAITRDGFDPNEWNIQHESARNRNLLQIGAMNN